MDTPSPARQQARRLMRAGWWIVLGAVVPLAAWIALAPLSMAVVAPAFVKVDLNRRPVQHLEGGIVRSVLVRDGQRVSAGEPVLVLGDVSVDAERNRLAYRAEVERAGIARLEAEHLLAGSVRFPPRIARGSCSRSTATCCCGSSSIAIRSRAGRSGSRRATRSTPDEPLSISRRPAR